MSTLVFVSLADAVHADALRTQNAAIEAESLLDDLVGEAVGCLAMFREPEYGGHPISDEDLKARANALATILGERFEIRRRT